MNECINCGGQVVAGPQNVERNIGERMFIATIDGWSCPKCGEIYYEGGGLEDAERNVAAWIANNGVTSAAEIKFMRKTAGIRAVDLAKWLDVTPETVSHWETGKHAPDVVTRATIASIVIEALKGENTTRERLAAQGKPDARQTVRLAHSA